MIKTNEGQEKRMDLMNGRGESKQGGEPTGGWTVKASNPWKGPGGCKPASKGVVRAANGREVRIRKKPSGGAYLGGHRKIRINLKKGGTERKAENKKRVCRIDGETR